MNQEVERILVEFKRRSRIERVFLIGSHAMGSPHENSDIDLVLIDDRFRDVTFYKRPVGLRRYWPKGVPVDFICLTPEEFESWKSRPTVARVALDEGVAIP